MNKKDYTGHREFYHAVALYIELSNKKFEDLTSKETAKKMQCAIVMDRGVKEFINSEQYELFNENTTPNT
jgi:hypothetical protein